MNECWLGKFLFYIPLDYISLLRIPIKQVSFVHLQMSILYILNNTAKWSEKKGRLINCGVTLWSKYQEINMMSEVERTQDEFCRGRVRYFLDACLINIQP